MKIFKSYSDYYDELYKEKNYTKESKFLIDLLSKHDPNAKSLLEYGAGTGGHAKILEKDNFFIDGVELSPQMVNKAYNSDNVKIFQGDMRSYISNKQYDAAFSLFHVFSYLGDNKDVLAFFQSCRKNIKKGGILVFDFWYGPAVWAQGLENNSRTFSINGKGFKRLTKKIHYPELNSVNVNFTIQEIDTNSVISEEDHMMRYYFKRELELFSLISNFEPLEFLTMPDGKNLDSTFWDGACVLRAI